MDYSFVLRLSSEQHRNVEQIKSELDFQKYLFNNGATVAKPLQTESGETCLPLKMDNSRFISSAFEYIEGKDWDERKDDSEQILIKKIGATLGKIHRLLKEYKPVNVAKRRLWSEQQELLQADIFKKHSVELHDKYLDFIRQMNKEEKNKDTFGLTHGDYLASNYLIDDDNITVIDFDECEYSWFAADLAICIRAYLFWTENPASLPQKADEAEKMHYNLLLGYGSENKITKDMVYDLEKYIKIRDYIELAKQLSFEPKTFNDYPIEETLFEMNLDRILNDKPFLKFSTAKAEKLLA